MAGAQSADSPTLAPGAAAKRSQDAGGEAEVIRTVELTKVYTGTDFAAVDKLNLSVHAG